MPLRGAWNLILQSTRESQQPRWQMETFNWRESGALLKWAFCFRRRTTRLLLPLCFSAIPALPGGFALPPQCSLSSPPFAFPHLWVSYCNNRHLAADSHRNAGTTEVKLDLFDDSASVEWFLLWTSKLGRCCTCRQRSSLGPISSLVQVFREKLDFQSFENTNYW